MEKKNQSRGFFHFPFKLRTHTHNPSNIMLKFSIIYILNKANTTYIKHQTFNQFVDENINLIHDEKNFQNCLENGK